MAVPCTGWEGVSDCYEAFDPEADNDLNPDEDWEPEIPEGAPGPEIILEEMEAEVGDALRIETPQDWFSWAFQDSIPQGEVEES